MDRRSFILGTLASGVAFVTSKILVPNDPVYKFVTGDALQQRIRRLVQAGYGTLLNCKLAYRNKEGAWSMPGMVSAQRLEPTVLKFEAAALKILQEETWTGCAFIDDEDFVISENSRFTTGELHTINGDTLKATMTYTFEREIR
jgi:hypothetical protein